MLFKQGGGHGGHVLFIQDGRLHYVYNFMGDDEQKVSSPGRLPLGNHIFGVALQPHRHGRRTATPRSVTSSLYVDGDAVATMSRVKAHPGTFGLAGATISVGRNTGSAVSSTFKAPYGFTGGTIAQVNVDLSGSAVRRRREGTRAGLLQRLMMEW